MPTASDVCLDWPLKIDFNFFPLRSRLITTSLNTPQLSFAFYFDFLSSFSKARSAFIFSTENLVSDIINFCQPFLKIVFLCILFFLVLFRIGWGERWQDDATHLSFGSMAGMTFGGMPICKHFVVTNINFVRLFSLYYALWLLLVFVCVWLRGGLFCLSLQVYSSFCSYMHVGGRMSGSFVYRIHSDTSLSVRARRCVFLCPNSSFCLPCQLNNLAD